MRINESKTKYLAINTQDEDHTAIHSSNSNEDGIEQVDDFVYLGAWIASTEYDSLNFKVRKVKAWAACHKMKRSGSLTYAGILR